MVNFGYPYNDIVICKDSTDYLPTFMVNFGYPYNDLVICKDSTDYLMFVYKVLVINVVHTC